MWLAKLIQRSLNDLDSDMDRVRAKTLGTSATKAPRMGTERVRVWNKQADGESILDAARDRNGR